MDKETAKKLCTVIETADNGCPVCVDDMCKVMSSTFPEWVWKMDEGGSVTVSAADADK